MSWNRGMPPEDTLVALVVRKWTTAIADGIRISFMVSDPYKPLAALGGIGGTDCHVSPTQTVRFGRVVADGEGRMVVLDEDGETADFDCDAILAWSPVPSFAMDQAAATETDLLLRRIAEKQRPASDLRPFGE